MNLTEKILIIKRAGFRLIPTVFLLLISSFVYSQDIKVQRGLTVVAAGSNNVILNAPADFTAVSNLNKAFVIITTSQNTGAGNDTGGGQQNADDATCTIRFNAVNQITISRIGAVGNTRVYWEIIEYVGAGGGDNEFIVRDQDIHTFAAAGINETLNFPAGAANTDNLVGFVTGMANPQTGRGEYHTGRVTLEFDDATTLRIRRGDASGNAVQVSYAIVDFIGANWTVERVEHTYAASGVAENENLVTAVNTANAFIHTQKRNFAGQNGLDEYGHQVWFPNGNQVSFQLRNTATVPADNTSVAWVVSNPDMTVSHTNGTRAKDAPPNVEPDTFNVVVPAVANMANASVFLNNDCTGGGTAFPRTMIGARLTAVDTVEMFRSDDGQNQAYRLSVVQWPLTAALTIDGTIYTDEGKTAPIAAGKNVSLSVNGAAVTTVTTQAGGTFKFELLLAPNPNDVLLVYLDGEAEKASLVTLTDGTTDLTGGNALQLVQNKVVLEYQTGASITNTNLDVIDGVDAGDDDGITIAGGNATFATTYELWISSGKNYAPGGDVTLADIEIFGTLTGGANTFTVNGSWNSNGGTFTAGTSTVNLATPTAATISGNTTFNDLSCNAVSKAITVAQGSTQTVSGRFSVDGNAFATRISFASSGGAGTTWNLVLNGTHDCRYVAVQGSNSSGTAFLPVNPVGFKDNQDNTNWYDPSLPSEMLFFDNFETSTLGAVPDKPSANWSILGAGAGWLSESSVIVNTQNHTTGGSRSMYSRGGNAGEGVGSWNFPGWGPQTNCTAEAWFYDDMQNNKMQWIFVDNAAGNQGAGVLIETNQGQGATKYRYCRYNFGGGTLYQDSFIDRTLGWHKVTWIHTEGTLDLYLDGALLMTAAGLSDFSDFDTGSWTWHNGAGSTPLWLDDFCVFRSQHQSAYRWYDDDNAQNPTVLAAENTAITRDINSNTRLRVQIQNDQYEAWSGDYIGLQYREGSNGTWTDLSASGDWDYANGLGTDDSQVANALLTNTDIRQHFIENVPSVQNLSMAYTEYGEWDFSIVPTTNSTIGATYYIRPVITTPAGVFKRSLAAYNVVGECQVTSPTLKQWTGANSSNWNDPGNWAGPGVPDNSFDVIIPNGTPACRVNIVGAQCKSILVQNGASLLLDTAFTSLTSAENVTVYGTVTHSNNSASLTLSSGTLRVEGATAAYNHSGNGAINAANATIQVINGGDYNVSGAPTVNVKTLSMAVGGIVNVSGAATINVEDFTVDLNGQWVSTDTANTVNISNNFTNNGSMLSSTGGVFNFNGASKTLAGSSTTTIFHKANFNSSTNITMTNTITVLNDLVIGTGDSMTASSGTIKVGGDWTNNGAFTHGGGTVELNGTALQQITAAGVNFNNLVQTNGSGAGVRFMDGFSTASLTNSTGNSTMTFNAGSTYDITDSSGLTLTGTAGNLVTLASSSPGTDWIISPSGFSWSVDYVAVSDSVNTNPSPIFPTNSADNGTTINWFDEDGDGDEIPDYWEYSYYGNTTNDASSDTDGDSLNLLDEFILDTDPTFTTSNTIYVDDNAGYIGDGSAGLPYKYLKDALDAATDGSLISLKAGTYELDDYALTKRVIIKGVDGAEKTIIRGATPDGGASDSGQMVRISSKNFGLQDVTLTLFRDDKPIISYQASSSIKIISISDVIFKDNNISTKSMIAPEGTKKPKRFYLYNTLSHSNSALSAAEVTSSKKAKVYNNTIVSNTFGSALIVSGDKETWLTNNILRNSSTEITDNSTGTLTVSFSNIEGGYGGATNSYDSAETFADAANGYYRLLIGSAGENAGTTTSFNWDLDDVARPKGAAFDVGCYETDPNDQDGDGLNAAQEIAAGSSPTDPDSDNDGITDGEEVNTYGTSPISSNTDGDFINDGAEPAMKMDPSVYDGVGDIMGVYYTSFESDVMFPAGPLFDTIWGPNGNASSSLVIKGNMTIENVGAVAAYDGVKVGKAQGDTPESSFVGWVDRNFLDNYWVSISYKAPRAKLPTDINEAFNIAGCFFAFDENGYLNVYNATTKNWSKDTQVTPDDWSRITIHRDHPGQIVNVWVETRQAFANVPVAGPHPTAGTGKFRMSFSSVGEQDAQFDLFSALPFAPF